jgi:Alpha-L-fucosidase C-terminal domain
MTAFMLNCCMIYRLFVVRFWPCASDESLLDLLDSIAEYFALSLERYTAKKSVSGTTVYAITLVWPRNNKLTLAAAVATPQTTVSMLGYQGTLNWKSRPTGGIVVLIPPIPSDQLPCQWAWVFRLEYLAE